MIYRRRVVNVVNGAGGEIGEYLATSKRIAKVAFTGSTEVGQQIMQYATQNIIPVTPSWAANRQISSLLM